MKVLRAISVVLLVSAIAAGCGKKSNDYSAPPMFSSQPKCLCAPVEARNMGQLLLQSNPLVEIDNTRWNNYVSWINSNAHLLMTNSPTMTCARNLGRALVSSGLNAFSRTDYNSSYGRVLEMGGTMEQAQDVAGSMQSGALDAFMTGQELIWLSEVIPSAAQGNWQPFHTTGTQSRRQFRELIPIIQQSGLGTDLNQLAPFLNQFESIVEEQMVMAACLFTR